MSVSAEDRELAVRAAWLSYVGGYNQSVIAGRLNVSRIKVHRLIALAHELGLVKVNIEHELTDLIALEEQLARGYGLQTAIVVPSLSTDNAPSAAVFTALGMAGARLLRRLMQDGKPLTIGLGWGRTLAAVAEQMPRHSYAQHRFVALIGSLTRHAAANPYDVIHRLVDRTDAEGYYMPVPYIVDTLADKAVFMTQRSVQTVLDLARRADLCLVGIGECSPASFLKRSGLITDAEFAELQAAGAVGDLIGQFFGRDGRLVDCEVNERCLGLPFEELRDRRAVAIAGGLDKLTAIQAALASGTLKGLITDEAVARRLVSTIRTTGARHSAGTDNRLSSTSLSP